MRLAFLRDCFAVVSRFASLISTDSQRDCLPSLSTNPIARSTYRGSQRNVGRQLACSLAVVVLGVLAAPETAFAQRTQAKDLNNLAGNPLTSGIWSDGEIMWVADSNASDDQATRNARIYAYDIESGARVTCNDDPSDYCEDFANLHPGNTHISAIWSDGDTMWVADWNDARIYAYSMEAKAAIGETAEERNEWAINQGFNLLRGTALSPDQTTRSNVGAFGLWSGTGPKTGKRIMWVSDIYLRRIFAYDMATKEHVPSEDFECADLLGGSLTPRGIWADRRTIWVVSSGRAGVWAFNRSSRAYDRTKSFDADRLTGDDPPRDIWSDGETMWLAYEGTSKTIYAFDLTGLDGSQAPRAASSGPCGSSGVTEDNGDGNGVNLPVLSIEDGRAVESAGTIDFTVTLSRDPQQTVSVSYQTSGAPDGGSAIEGTDYTRARSTLRIPANTRSGTISVSLRDDSLNEDDETFTLTLTSATNASLSSTPSRNEATGTIRDDDADLPVLSIEGGRTVEAPGATVTFTVTLAPESGREVAVNWATVDGTATQGQDYQRDSGTLTFSAGDTSKTISVTVTDDTADEAVEEEFTVRLSSPRNATLSPDASSATGTIVDDDGPPSISIEDGKAREGTRRIDFAVTLIPQSSQVVDVPYRTRDGTAVAGKDYVAVTDGTLTFSAGQTEKRIRVTVTNDSLDEDDETFEVVLTEPSNAELGSASATGTIEDDDDEPQLTISNVSASEADEMLDFTVRLNRASGKTITVQYETADGTATHPGDYTGTGGVPVTLTFDPSTDPPETEKTISVPVTNDALNEVNETFTVTLSEPSNAVFPSGQMSISATGTIQNDDPLPTLRFQPSSLTSSGNEGGTVEFVVELDSPSGQPVMVTYRTRDGTATEREDYTETSGTLTFLPGETQMTIQVPVKDDNINEGDESFMLDLSVNSQSNAQVDTQQRTATGTITDDDPLPTGITLTVNPNTISEGAGSQAVSVTATLVGSVRNTSTTVNVTVSGSGNDGRVGYSVNRSTFPIQVQEGRRSGTASFSLTPTNNDVDETNETVTVSGTEDIANISVTSATITLTDNDGTPSGVTLSVRPTSISESASATTVTVTAWLDGSAVTSDTVVSVTVSKIRDTGAPDFTASPASFDLTIPQDTQSGTGTFTLTPTNDEVDGPDATAAVSGTTSVGSVSSATLTVTDNDTPSTQVTLSVDPNLVSEDEGSTPIAVTATLNRSARTVPTEVNVQASGSARPNVVGFQDVTSFSITIPVGSRQGTGSFNLVPVDNEVAEGSETLTLSGSTPVPGLDVRAVTLVLNDDDGGTPGRRPPGPIVPPRDNGGTITVNPDSEVVPAGDGDVQPGFSARAIALGTPLAPTPAKIVIWTDQTAYQPGDELMLYRTMDPMGDLNQYTLFFYREDIHTGERRYFAGGAGSTALDEEVIDHYSMGAPAFRIAPIEQVEKQLVWSGSVPASGLWHFVAELRSPDTTQVLKRAHAKFVVASNTPMTLGEGGSLTEIATDTTWINDTIYKLRAGVTVKSGATLTIEPGTVIQAKGADAAIIVEKGGRIVAQGRREAPVLMTCEGSVGEREAGCWGGLVVRGNAPVSSDEGTMNGAMSEMEPLYGGDDADDSSGVLRFVRVEFAGGSSDTTNRPASIGFHGVGSGTVIDHVQAHGGAGDGIAFRGGTAHCGFCVSSGARYDSLDWAEGWRGTAQHMYIQQGSQGEHGIEASDSSSASTTQSQLRAAQYNVTLVGGASLDDGSSSGDGIRLDSGATLSARNVVLTGFGGAALDVQGDSVATFMAGGASSLRNALLHANGGLLEAAQIKGGVDSYIDFTDMDPMLRNIRYEGNPDPRPKHGSPALEFGVSAIPPADGTLTSTAEYIGAFGTRNWLEEWTFFGPESDYEVPGTMPETD